ERKIETSNPSTPSTPSTPPEGVGVSGSADARPHQELVESALNRIRRTTADLTGAVAAPRATPVPPPVRTPAAREEVPRPTPPIRVEERLPDVATPASLPAAPAARQREALPPTPSVIRERSEGRQVVTVPPTAPPTRAKTTDELVQDARRLAPPPAPPIEEVPERERVSQPPLRPRVETEIIPLSSLLRSLGMQEERPASFWIRSMAGGWDLEVLAVAYLPIFASYATVNTILARETLVVLAALLVVLVFVYQSVTLLLAGRTFGMAMQQLRLAPLAAGETRIYWHQHLRRAAGATVAFCCPPLNLLARALHRRGLSIPDQFSGTIPVEVSRTPRTR
ncbi:MAG: RDD family protein, partial [Blastocatellia bacterium]